MGVESEGVSGSTLESVEGWRVWSTLELVRAWGEWEWKVRGLWAVEGERAWGEWRVRGHGGKGSRSSSIRL